MVIFENIDIDIDKAIPKISISISIWWFWKISISILISIRQFCKISISIKYRIDSNLAYRTGLNGMHSTNTLYGLFADYAQMDSRCLPITFRDTKPNLCRWTLNRSQTQFNIWCYEFSILKRYFDDMISSLFWRIFSFSLAAFLPRVVHPRAWERILWAGGNVCNSFTSIWM